MRLRATHLEKAFTPLRIANCQLCHQVIPLVMQLSARHRDDPGTPRGADLVTCKFITANARFRMHTTEIVRDRRNRRRLSPEALELWMVSIPLGLPAQHGLCEEPFSPQCDETATIEIFGM